MDATHKPEEWRPIPGFEGAYEVSDQGRVRSMTRVVIRRNGRPIPVKGRILRSFKGDRYDHQAVGLGADRRNRRYVHIVVLEAFIGPRPAGTEACHDDGDVFNNRLSNLRWDTPSSNQLDRAPHGTHHNAQKTHCVNGHEFTLENTRWRPPRTGHPRYVNPRPSRDCRACHRERYHARKAA